MAIEGLIGAGAQAGLDQLLARQMAEQQMQMRMRALEAEEENRSQALAVQQQAIAQRDRDSARDYEMQDKARRDRSNQAGVEDLMMQHQLQLQEEARNAPKPVKLRAVTVRGQKGEPINRMVPEDEAVEEYREPKAPPSGAVDQEWVLRGGAPTPIRKGTAQPGDLPYNEKAAGGGKSSEQDARIQKYAADKIAAALATAKQVRGMAGPGSTGAMNLTKHLPGTPARSMENVLNQLKALLAFKELTAMRGASPTGGGLGSITERELDLLGSVEGGLDPMAANFASELDKVVASLERAQAGIGSHGIQAEMPGGGGVAPQTRPIPGIPGAEAALVNGKWIRVR